MHLFKQQIIILLLHQHLFIYKLSCMFSESSSVSFSSSSYLSPLIFGHIFTDMSTATQLLSSLIKLLCFLFMFLGDAMDDRTCWLFDKASFIVAISFPKASLKLLLNGVLTNVSWQSFSKGASLIGVLAPTCPLLGEKFIMIFFLIPSLSSLRGEKLQILSWSSLLELRILSWSLSFSGCNLAGLALGRSSMERSCCWHGSEATGEMLEHRALYSCGRYDLTKSQGTNLPEIRFPFKSPGKLDGVAPLIANTPLLKLHQYAKLP